MADDTVFGTFSEEPVLKWLTDSKTDRNMQLTHDFVFTDAAGREWKARKCLTVDGASIPKALWSLVGSPYTGNYRRASIIHDQYCVDHPHDGDERKAADAMFQAACRAGGCSARQARLLYLGVRIGSSWTRVRGQKNLGIEAQDTDEVQIELSPEDLAIQAEYKLMAYEVEAMANTNMKAANASPQGDVELVDRVMAAHGY